MLFIVHRITLDHILFYWNFEIDSDDIVCAIQYAFNDVKCTVRTIQNMFFYLCFYVFFFVQFALYLRLVIVAKTIWLHVVVFFCSHTTNRLIAVHSFFYQFFPFFRCAIDCMNFFIYSFVIRYVFLFPLCHFDYSSPYSIQTCSIHHGLWRQRRQMEFECANRMQFQMNFFSVERRQYTKHNHTNNKSMSKWNHSRTSKINVWI